MLNRIPPKYLWILLALVVGCIVAASLIGAARTLGDRAHGGHPACTDAIADAGGICWGEPR